MSKFRALVASALLASVVAGGAAVASGTAEAGNTKAPVARIGGSYCC